MSIKKELQKIKELDSFSARISYIWDYYKIPIIGIIISAIFVISFISSYLDNAREVALSAIFVNSSMLSKECETLQENYAVSREIDLNQKQLQFDCSLSIVPEAYDSYNVGYTVKLSALFQTNSIDAFLSDLTTFETYAKQGVFADLNKLLPRELLDQYRDKLHYVTITEGDSSYEAAVGFCLDGSKKLDSIQAYKESPYFGIVVSSPNQETAVDFLCFLLEQ